MRAGPVPERDGITLAPRFCNRSETFHSLVHLRIAVCVGASWARGRRISSMVIERHREAVNADQGIGPKGYDPVAYFINGVPTKGSDQYSLAWKGVTYRFASAENLEMFKADPDKYLPQYGGYCEYAMSFNRIADIDPSRWAIVNGKLCLNNGFVAEKLWSLNKNGNIVSADRNWPQYPKKTIGE
jgi:YHS domain-containing protein